MRKSIVVLVATCFLAVAGMSVVGFAAQPLPTHQPKSASPTTTPSPGPSIGTPHKGELGTKDDVSTNTKTGGSSTEVKPFVNREKADNKNQWAPGEAGKLQKEKSALEVKEAKIDKQIAKLDAEIAKLEKQKPVPYAEIAMLQNQEARLEKEKSKIDKEKAKIDKQIAKLIPGSEKHDPKIDAKEAKIDAEIAALENQVIAIETEIANLEKQRPVPFEKIAMLYRELVAKNKEITALNKESVALDRHEYNLDVHGPTGSGQGVSGSAGGKGQGGEVIPSPQALPPDYPRGERTTLDGQSVKYDKVEQITNHKPTSLQELVPEQPYLPDGVTLNAKFKGPWWVISDHGSRFQTYKRPSHWPLPPGEGIEGGTPSTGTINKGEKDQTYTLSPAGPTPSTGTTKSETVYTFTQPPSGPTYGANPAPVTSGLGETPHGPYQPKDPPPQSPK